MANYNKISKKGRFGDSQLRGVQGEPSHVNAYEAYLVDQYGKAGEDAVSSMGSGTTNPITGLREYFTLGGFGGFGGFKFPSMNLNLGFNIPKMPSNFRAPTPTFKPLNFNLGSFAKPTPFAPTISPTGMLGQLGSNLMPPDSLGRGSSGAANIPETPPSNPFGNITPAFTPPPAVADTITPPVTPPTPSSMTAT